MAQGFITMLYHRTSKSLRVLNQNLDFQMASEVKYGVLLFSSLVSGFTSAKHLDTWHMAFTCPHTTDQPQKN